MLILPILYKYHPGKEKQRGCQDFLTTHRMWQFLFGYVFIIWASFEKLKSDYNHYLGQR